MLFNLLLISVSIICSIIGIGYVLSHREKYGTNINIVLIIINFLFVGIIYFLTFNLSSLVNFGKDVSLLYFKLTVITSLFSLSMLSSIQCLILIDNKNLKFFPMILYSFMGGLLTLLVFLPGAIDIIRIDDVYYLIFKNPLLTLFFIIFFIIVFLITWTIHLKNRSKIINKELSLMMNGIVFLFTITIILYLPYFFIQNIIFKNLHLIIYIIAELFVLYSVIKKPYLFIALTNKIYDFIVFHRSGILLFSYNNETGEETDDTMIKGTILIGINHILAHFKQKEEALNLIRIKDRDIILEYNNEHGYAVLLTVNKSNKIIRKSVKQFIDDFAQKFKETLEKINNYSQIIDVSVFNNAKDLLFQLFSPYIKKANL